nr:MAG TPA: hypothetical protein [Caudoviricetes sp.]
MRQIVQSYKNLEVPVYRATRMVNYVIQCQHEQ